MSILKPFCDLFTRAAATLTLLFRESGRLRQESARRIDGVTADIEAARRRDEA